MRRLTLSTKMLSAMLPLTIAVAVLLAFVVSSDIETISEAENGERLGMIWDPVVDVLDAIETEQATFIGSPDSTGDDTGAPDATGEAAEATIEAARRATDVALNELRVATDWLSSSEAAANHVTAARSALSAARRGVDLGVFTAETDMLENLEPTIGYELAASEVIAIGQLLPGEAASADLGGKLLSVVKLAEAQLRADRVAVNVLAWQNGDTGVAALQQARATFVDLEASLGEFVATAPDEWADQYRNSESNAAALTGFRAGLTQSIRDVEAGRAGTFDVVAFSALSDEIGSIQSEILDSIVADAAAAASSARTATLIRMVIVLLAVLVAAVIAIAITRSITRRIQAVASGANLVAEQQLPALVEALSDERGNAVLPEIVPLSTQGSDELAELAQSFNSVQTTLVEVANEQVEVLRRGVSDIFVTMARRNRSLIDRQLAMLDEYEAEVDDPSTLSNYYQLDHLATRMRRNSESLLVLANAEPKRRRVKATEIDDVVRASISEVEDYKRIQIEALESLQVRGNVVADVSHLLAELFDNATSFSPPGSPVRVGGRRIQDSYVIRIVDDGVGIGDERLVELNSLLREPPVIGLSASTTLGMSVVSLLASKHGISVTLAAGNPGVTVDVILPSSLFGPIEEPLGGAPGAVAAAQGLAVEGGGAPADDPYALPADADPYALPDQVASAPTEPAAPAATPGLDLATGGPNYDILKTPEPEPEPTPAPAPVAEPVVDDSSSYDPFGDDEQRVVQSDLSSLSSSLAAFRSGMQSASTDDATDPYAFPGDEQEPAEIPAALPSDQVTPTQAPAAPEAPQAPTAEDDFDLGSRIDAITAATAAPEVATPEVATPDIPPPPMTAPPAPAGLPTAEFAVPPAPPMTPSGPSSQPVAPDTARPAPKIDPVPETLSLPTRSPGSQDVDSPDRIADGMTAGTEPSALSAALTAFDTPHIDSSEDLPSREHGDEPMSIPEDPTTVAPSRLDPEAFRERLRSFQSEFSTGRDVTDGQTDNHLDLGGDLR